MTRWLTAFLVVGFVAMVLVSGVILSYRAAQDIQVAHSEKAPADYSVEKLAATYGGEHWLTITGRLRLDAMDVRHAKRSPDGSMSATHVWVPMIGAEEGDQAPIQILINFGRNRSPIRIWRSCDPPFFLC